MRKVTVWRMRERYAQTVLTFRITYVYVYMCVCVYVYIYIYIYIYIYATPNSGFGVERWEMMDCTLCRVRNFRVWAIRSLKHVAFVLQNITVIISINVRVLVCITRTGS